MELCRVVVKICLSGILRGSGRQKVGVVTNLLGFYFLGIPLGTLLALKAGLGVLGCLNCISPNGRQ